MGNIPLTGEPGAKHRGSPRERPCCASATRSRTELVVALRFIVRFGQPGTEPSPVAAVALMLCQEKCD